MKKKKEFEGIVYSSEYGRMCPKCGHQKKSCICKSIEEIPSGDGIVRVKKDTKKRQGKTVTVITGVLLKEKELKELAKKLKKRCQSGGTVKDGVIEIQGDFVEVAKELLEKEKISVKI